MQLIKCTLIFFLMSNLGFGQYSDYYKNFSGDLKKNPDNNMSINDIDLQELVEKNIKLELNRIPNTNFAFNRDRVFASQIANRPELAYNYGVDKMFFWGKEDRKKYKTGRKWNIYFKKPHYFIFDLISANKLFNTSSTGISTTITIFGSVPRKPELGFFRTFWPFVCVLSFTFTAPCLISRRISPLDSNKLVAEIMSTKVHSS